MNRTACSKTLLLAVLCGVLFVDNSSIPMRAETSAQRDRMQWWRDARFGLFLHWGLYAIPAGEWNGKSDYAEWIRNRAKIPLDIYGKFLHEFNPTEFDADEWARMAKAAGMKYVVITSKHHDGFCLWPSAETDFDVASTPFKRDILGELKAACDKQGLVFCLYYSIMDWHHPDYLPRRDWEKDRSTDGADYSRYFAYMKAQLKELVQRYDPGVLWFDGEWEDTWTHKLGMELDDYVRSLKPDIIINNRVDKGRPGTKGMTKNSEFRGDFGTPEQQIPATGIPGQDWESCMTMNRHWGFNRKDTDFKSTNELIQKLIDIASKGGNFLLNVGPTATGKFPQTSVERLAEIGSWMDVNGEAIYGTSASPIAQPDWGRVTCKPERGTVYLHIFDWPVDGRLEVEDLPARYSRAIVLAGNQQVPVNYDGNKLTLDVSKVKENPFATVVRLHNSKDTKHNGSQDAAQGETDKTLHPDGPAWRFERTKRSDPDLPRVLLIGDSILNGYRSYVADALNGEAIIDVWVNPHYQSEKLNRLLAEKLEGEEYDVIHFNVGLHGWQEGRIKPGTFKPLTNAYVEVIREKCPHAKLIWASSTPVTMQGNPSELEPEINPIIVEHNRMAAEVMREMDVRINDFYGLLIDKLELARGDRFHWTTPAYKLLGNQAAESIRAALAKQGNLSE